MTESREQIADFSLPASTGQTLGLDSFKGKVPLAIVFAHLDSDEDRELLYELSSHHKDFGVERSQILVVARATAKETRQVSEDEEWTVPILADASGAMARDFGAEDEDGSSRRIAVVADKQGRVM